MLKALHGVLMVSILHYNKFRKDIEVEGYKVNPCDVCIVKKTIKGKKHTLTWHTDDVKASHVDSNANDKFYKWAEKKHGSDDLGHVTVTRGNTHDCLGMILDYTKKQHVKVDMKHYQEAMSEEFPEEIMPNGKAPWNDALFKANNDSPSLNE